MTSATTLLLHFTGAMPGGVPGTCDPEGPFFPLPSFHPFSEECQFSCAEKEGGWTEGGSERGRQLLYSRTGVGEREREREPGGDRGQWTVRPSEGEIRAVVRCRPMVPAVQVRSLVGYPFVPKDISYLPFISTYLTPYCT